eukprot:scaffold317015_cov52-Prasinocladus_malaysianus.AAC.2
MAPHPACKTSAMTILIACYASYARKRRGQYSPEAAGIGAGPVSSSSPGWGKSSFVNTRSETCKQTMPNNH